MLADGLGVKGLFWTFKKKVVGGTFTRVRLDRALGSAGWSAQFPLASFSHLTAATSDHCPIFLEINEPGAPSGRRGFRYEPMWETHEQWQETILEKWSSKHSGHTVEEIQRKLTALATDLSKWNKDSFGSVRKEIRALKLELDHLRGDPARSGPSHVELKINDKLVELYHREELIWRQRSRIEWLASGDKNTSFFHLRASIRRKKNVVKALANSFGVLIDDPGELREMVNDFYQTLYTSEIVTGLDEVMAHVPVKVTVGMNDILCAPYTNEEVKVALFQMFPTKARGPDGFPAHFY